MKSALVLGVALALALVLFLLLGRGSRRGDGSPARGAPPPATAPAETAAPTAEAAPAALDRPLAARTSPGAGPASSRSAPERAPSAPTRVLSGVILVQGEEPLQASVRLFAAGELAAETTASERGAFRLSLATPAESVVLRVEAEGYASLEKELGNQQVPGELPLGNLYLQRGVELAGSVVGPDAAPIEGALVRLTLRRGAPSEHAIGDTARTDTAGRFRFAAAPRGPVVLAVRAPGFGERSTQAQAGGPSEPRIELAPAHDLAVRVRARGGAPLAAVAVELRSSDPSVPPRRAATDAQGCARFEDLAGTSFAVRATARGFRPGGLPEVATDGAEALVELAPWPSIAGRLVTPEGEPAPAGARVLALPRAAAARGDAGAALGEPVDADGRFRLLDLRPGEYVVRAEASGYAPTLSGPALLGQEGEVALGDLVLQRGGALVLELTLAGAPAAGITAELSATAPLPNQLLAPRTRGAPLPASDAAGRLVLDGLATGEVWVILRGPGAVARSAGPLHVRAGATSDPLALALQPGARLLGRVLDAAGQGVARARLRVRGAAEIPFLEADGAGRFETPPLPPGSYTLECLPGAGHEHGAATEVRLEGREDRTVELRLAD